MPQRLTLATGLDALCHAVEAYWAKSSNLMAQELAKTAIRLIVKYLPKVLAEGAHLSYRKKMCLGSLFAGLAFAQTHTTACHSISYPLTMTFGIEHGLACALTLARVMEMNLPLLEEKGDLLEALGVQSPAELQEWLDQTAAGIVRLRLGAFGIREKDLSDLVTLSFTQGRMDNNPVDVSPEDVQRMLRSLL
jgi:alcohol dehydrogenase class IV